MKDDRINLLHKRENTAAKKVEPKEGERTLLCSNESGRPSPSLDLDSDSHLVSEKMLLDQLAEIIVDIFLLQQHDINTTQKSGDLLPGINERAS